MLHAKNVTRGPHGHAPAPLCPTEPMQDREDIAVWLEVVAFGVTATIALPRIQGEGYEKPLTGTAYIAPPVMTILILATSNRQMFVLQICNKRR